MAFNWQTFRTRALTAAVFVMVMLTGLLWNHWSFLLLFSVIHFGCWWEYLKLTEKIYNKEIHIYIKEGLMLAGFGLMLWFCGEAYTINGYGIRDNLSFLFSLAGFVMILLGVFQKTRISPKVLGTGLLGLLYISLCWGLMITLRQEGMVFKGSSLVLDAGRVFPVLIILSIWVNDTMAYLVGSLAGRTPLSKISPKKTWEGTVGGVLLSVLLVALSGPAIKGAGSYITCGAIAFIASVTGTIGDLLESKLKRAAGVKDSGQIMPGHGGFLDRFDSMLLATPFVWLCLFFFL